jgi:hypothetical protein
MTSTPTTAADRTRALARALGSLALTAVVVFSIAYFLSRLMVATQLRCHDLGPTLPVPPASWPLTIILGLLLFGGLHAIVRRSRRGLLVVSVTAGATVAVLLSAAPAIPHSLGGIAPYCATIDLVEPFDQDTNTTLGVHDTGDPQVPYRTAPQKIVDVGGAWLRIRTPHEPLSLSRHDVRRVTATPCR